MRLVTPKYLWSAAKTGRKQRFRTGQNRGLQWSAMRTCILMLLFPVVLTAQTGNVSNPPQAQPAPPSQTQSQPATQPAPNAVQQNAQQQEATNSDQFRADA